MKLEHLGAIPSSPERDWFEERYRELARALEGTPADAPDAAWVALAARWNELRCVLQGERSRRRWGESRDVRDAAAEAAARRFRTEILPLATREDGAIRARLLEPRPRAALERAHGPWLLRRWELEAVARDPRNADLDARLATLEADSGRIRGGATIELDGARRTLGQVAALLESPDAALRERAFRALERFYGGLAGDLDALFDRLVGLRTEAGRRAGFPSFTRLAYARQGRSDYGPAEVARFRERILEHVVPLVGEIRARQARELGAPSVRPWDAAWFPGETLPPASVPIAGQVAAARRVFAELHPALAARWDDLVARGHADLEDRPGKEPGGYCTFAPDRGEVRIFCTSTGGANDVSMLVHEFGHAFQHAECLAAPAIDLISPTSEACEVFSMGLEYLALPHQAGFFVSPGIAARYRRRKLTRATTLIAQVALGDEFQEACYERPETSADERARLWAELTTRYLPGVDWAGHEETLGRGWHRQPHLFGLPFYFIEYGLAEVCALQLHALARRDPAEAVARWLRLARIGGARSFLGLLEAGGLASPFDPGTLPPLVELIREELGL